MFAVVHERVQARMPPSLHRLLLPPPLLLALPLLPSPLPPRYAHHTAGAKNGWWAAAPGDVLYVVWFTTPVSARRNTRSSAGGAQVWYSSRCCMYAVCSWTQHHVSPHVSPQASVAAAAATYAAAAATEVRVVCSLCCAECKLLHAAQRGPTATRLQARGVSRMVDEVHVLDEAGNEMPAHAEGSSAPAPAPAPAPVPEVCVCVCVCVLLMPVQMSPSTGCRWRPHHLGCCWPGVLRCDAKAPQPMLIKPHQSDSVSTEGKDPDPDPGGNRVIM